MQEFHQGWLSGVQQIESPNFDARPADTQIELIVLHNISLPPSQYGGRGIEQLFTNQLDPHEHPYYAQIAHLRVSAHFLIQRTGEVTQFVSCDQRAWHAGQSMWRGRSVCNDFSIGIELEGSDFEPFIPAQYDVLMQLLQCLCAHYPITAITGHSDIAPLRKTDPGPYFNWAHLVEWAQLKQISLDAAALLP